MRPDGTHAMSLIRGARVHNMTSCMKETLLTCSLPATFFKNLSTIHVLCAHPSKRVTPALARRRCGYCFDASAHAALWGSPSFECRSARGKRVSISVSAASTSSWPASLNAQPSTYQPKLPPHASGAPMKLWILTKLSQRNPN